MSDVASASSDLITSIDPSYPTIDSILDADGSLGTLRSPSLVLQSILALGLSMIFLLGGRKFHRFSTSASLGLSSTFLVWAIVVNVEPPQGLGPTQSSPESRALSLASIMVCAGLVGAAAGYHSAWWGSTGAGLISLGANAGLSLSFGLLLLGNDLLIHSQPAAWLLVLTLVLPSTVAVMRKGYLASLSACSLMGGFLFLIGVDLLINAGHEGLGKGMCFLIDHNPDHRAALQGYLPPQSTRVMIVISWLISLLSFILHWIVIRQTTYIPPEAQPITPYVVKPENQQLQVLEIHLPNQEKHEESVKDEKACYVFNVLRSIKPALVKLISKESTHSPTPSGENYHGTAGERLSCQRSFDPPLTLDTHTYPTNNRHETVDVLDFGQNQSSLPEDRATNLTSDPNHIAPQSVVRFPHCAPSKPKTVGRTPRLALSPSVYTRYRRTSRSAHTPFTTTHTPSPTSIHNVLAHHSPTPLLVPQDMSSYSYPTHFQPHQPLNTFHDFSTGSKRTSWANNRPQRSSLLPRSKTKRSTTSSSDQALYETAESELDSTTNFGRPPNRSHDRAPRAPELTYDTGMDSSGDSDNKNVGNWCLGQRSTSNLPYFWPFSTGEEQVTFRNHPGAMQCEAAVQTSRINSIQPVVSDVISPYSSFPQLLSGEVIANHHQPMEMEDQISDGENWARYY